MARVRPKKKASADFGHSHVRKSSMKRMRTVSTTAKMVKGRESRKVDTRRRSSVRPSTT